MSLKYEPASEPLHISLARSLSLSLSRSFSSTDVVARPMQDCFQDGLHVSVIKRKLMMMNE